MEMATKAAALLLIIVVGYLIKRRGWVDDTAVKLFGKILINITLPAAIVTSFNTVEITPRMLYVTGLGFVVVFIGQAAGFLVARSQGRQAQALAVLNVGPFNIGLFAIPYLATFVGPEGILFAGLFDIGNGLASIVFGYTAAMLLARGRGSVHTGRALLRAVLMPVFVSYVGMVALRLAGLTIPAPVIGFTSIVGAANTFLAMMMIGIGLQIVLDRSRYAAAGRILVTRYAVVIALALVVWFLLPLPVVEKTVIIMVLAAPIASLSAAFTAEAGLDVGVSTFAISTSVLVSIAAMPLVGLLLAA
nr:hypothetical protein [Propionibacterium sp.]